MPKSKLVPKIKKVLVILANPAGVQQDGENKEGAPSRENQPWFVFLPSLGVSLVAVDRHGAQIKGYWELDEAKAWAGSVYSQLANDPELLAETRDRPAIMPAVWDGYKLMSTMLSVPIT